MMNEHSRKRICLVDDDAKLIGLITRFLNQNGFSDVITLTAERLMTAQGNEADLFILDVMMPGVDGLTLCRELKKRSSAMILFLSARSDVVDRVVGLEVGADDYLTKPFEPRELLARVNALFRRREEMMAGPSAAEGILDFGDFSFDLDRQCVEKDGERLTLTTYEYSLLRLLCRNAGIVLTRERILQMLEREDFYSCDRSVDIGVSRLRKKLETDSRQPRYILTVWGRGYQFVSPKETKR